MKARTVERPGGPDAAAAVAAGIADEALVTLFGRCEVVYDGRASSYLGPGDRLVVLKPDGTLLVHRGEQRTPVNWQPPGSAHTASVHDDCLVVTSERETPTERIDVTFETVYSLSVFDVEDEEALELSGTEADLRERVLDEPELVEPGFSPDETERATDVGAADIVGTDEAGRTVVVELKRRRVGPTAAGQLARYVDALARETDEDVRGILVAPSITDGARRLLDEEGLTFQRLEP